MDKMERIAQMLKDNKDIKEEEVRDILNKEFGFNFYEKDTKDEMISAFFAMYKDATNVADEVAYGNI